MLSELTLDIRTLAFVATLAAVMQAVLLTVLWRAVPRSPGTLLWALGGALLALGFILLAFRHLLPDALSIVVANVAIASAHALYLLGIDRYCGQAGSYRFVAGVLTATLVLFMVFGLFTPDVGIRIVTISLAILALSGLSAVRLWGRDQSLRSPVDVMMAAMFFVHGTFHLFRGAYSLLLERGIEDFMAASTIHAFAFIDVIVFCFASGIGFAVLTISSLHRSLEKQLVDKNRLFSVLAHDLRSPFGGLVHLTDLIQIAFSKNQQDKVEDLARQVSVNAKQVLALLDDLLVWGRAEFNGEKARREPLDLAALFNTAFSAQAQLAADKGIEIRREFEVTTAFGVRTHAEMVLRNLISNAVKFSEPEKEIVIRSSLQDGRVLVSVLDDGIGLSGATESSADGVSYLTSRRGTAGEKGTGLGLTLCFDLCRGDGQGISLTDNPGGGAVASFTLDVWHPGESHSAPAREEVSPTAPINLVRRAG